MPKSPSFPAPDCKLCPRLCDFRTQNRDAYPGWFNAPVPSFGDITGEMLVVGLAPGLKGANRTGRPFTGDYAGDLLYDTLLRYQYAEGKYGADPKDGLRLINCRITNAVRCLPPQNKPTGKEVATCAPFLAEEIRSMKNLKVILALGGLAHGAVFSCLKEKKSRWKFGHNQFHKLHNLIIADSYHCSRYNTNTGRLTEAMFHDVFDGIQVSLAN